MESRSAKAYACYEEGLNHSWNGKKATAYPYALTSLKEAYEFFSQNEKNSKILADTAFCLAYCYFRQNQADQAIIYAQQSNDYYEQSKNLNEPNTSSNDEKNLTDLPSLAVCNAQTMLGSLIIGLSFYQLKESRNMDLHLAKFVEAYDKLPANAKVRIKTNDEVQKIIGDIDITTNASSESMKKINSILINHKAAEKSDPFMFNLLRGNTNQTKSLHPLAAGYGKTPTANNESMSIDTDSNPQSLSHRVN